LFVEVRGEQTRRIRLRGRKLKLAPVAFRLWIAGGERPRTSKRKSRKAHAMTCAIAGGEAPRRGGLQNGNYFRDFLVGARVCSVSGAFRAGHTGGRTGDQIAVISVTTLSPI
jgi:hypothetical protein